MAEKVIIIGGSPAGYMCAIYLFTANMEPVVLKKISKDTFDFKGYDRVAGVKNVDSPEKFVELVEAQAKNMGISVIQVENIDINECSEGFTIEVDGVEYKSEAVVIDDYTLLKKYQNKINNDGWFNTKNKISYNEAIVISGAGCMTAFEVKDYLEKK